MYTVSIWHSLAYYKNIIYIWTRTETYVWNETAPKQIRGQIFQSIWSFVFVACFRCCCYKNLHFSIFVNLKANRNQFRSILKYIWFLKMIVQNSHSLQSKCEVQRWKHVIRDFSIPLLRLSIFYGSRDQHRPGFFLHKRNEVGTLCINGNIANLQHSKMSKSCMYIAKHI